MNEAVAAWFEDTNNPMAPVMRSVRDIIMEDPDVIETVKYRAPAFEHDGLMCYFNWSSKKRVSLIFPSGRTGTLTVSSGLFQTLICSTSVTPMT